METPQRPLLPKNVTLDDVKKLVLQHGKLTELTVRRDNESYTGLFKKPTLAILSACAAKSDDPIASARLMYNSCKVVVDEEVEKDDELLVGMFTLVGKLFRTVQGEVGEVYA